MWEKRMKIMIHACPERKWYVDQYLVPSLLQQGLKEKDILVYTDEDHDGNLVSTLKSFGCVAQKGSTWHLQDDVIIASDFVKSIKYFDKNNKQGVICGYYSEYDQSEKSGVVNVNRMWYSFPCIRIPNYYARGFIKWIHQKEAENAPKYWLQITNNMFDDSLFKSFMQEKHPDDYVFNVNPNLVENIDYLIGGSTLSKRDKIIKSKFFKETKLIEELKSKLSS